MLPTQQAYIDAFRFARAYQPLKATDPRPRVLPASDDVSQRHVESCYFRHDAQVASLMKQYRVGSKPASFTRGGLPKSRREKYLDQFAQTCADAIRYLAFVSAQHGPICPTECEEVARIGMETVIHSIGLHGWYRYNSPKKKTEEWWTKAFLNLKCGNYEMIKSHCKNCLSV